MSARYVNIDRETPMLLPPDLREWVAEDEIARLILEAVELCDLSSAQVNVRGTGSEQYPPTMMLALLIYCYARRIFSSRQIEQATYDSIALRYICANTHPDHDTIARFRRSHAELFKQCMAQVLLMAQQVGALRVGTISLDGTRVAGTCSAQSVLTLDQINRELAQLELLGAELLAKAEDADGKDRDADGTQMPAALTRSEVRREKLLAAKAMIQRRQEALKGKPSYCPRASVTEPETQRLRRGGFQVVQGYNAQVCVDGGHSGLILGAHVSESSGDYGQINHGLATIPAQIAAEIKVALVDSGFDHTADIVLAEGQHGILVLCPPQARLNAKPNKRRRGRAAWKWRQRRTMDRRLECPLLKALYRRRAPTAEGVMARIKRHLGFQRFHCWGRHNVSAEWQLICLAHNVRQLALRGTPR